MFRIRNLLLLDSTVKHRISFLYMVNEVIDAVVVIQCIGLL
jgi:hypothetical protein